MNPDSPVKSQRSTGAAAILSLAIFIICALGVIVFLYNQNQSLKVKLAGYENPTPVATPIPTPRSTDESVVKVITPLSGSTTKSPLKVIGTVPAGWMFEGVFPIKLLDSKGKVVGQAQAKEKVAGSWQSGNPVDFEATITFKSSTGSGTLVLENDNPSGNPENDKKFEVIVNY